MTECVLSTDRRSPPAAKGRRPRLCYVMTAADSTVLLRGQLAYFRDRGYEVELVCSPGTQLDTFLASESVAFHPIPMKRDMSPLDDVRSLLRLYRHFRAARPDIVNASTPKAGLLGMVAAWLARTPARVYVLRGLRLETTRGVQRWLLKAMERLAARCAQRVVCVGEGLRAVYVRMGLARARKTTVIGSGTSNGVAPTAAAPRESDQGRQERERIRREWNLPPESLVYGVVGRITADKGIVDMLQAFNLVASVRPEARLVLIGNYEHGDPVAAEYRPLIDSNPKIVTTGFVNEPSRLLNAIDVLVHPSLREGFPNAPMEAAAAALPVIGRRVTGMTDAVLDGQTGVLVDPRGHKPLAEAMLGYVDGHVARVHGEAGRERVQSEFSRERVWEGLDRLYKELLGANEAEGADARSRSEMRDAA